MRIGPAALAFGGPALAVVVISAAVTMRHGDAETHSQPIRFSGSTVVQRLPSLLASPRLADAISVVIIRDEAAASYYDKPAALDSIVATWRNALTSIGADVRVLSSADALDDHMARVLVVPSSPCLTMATREAIDEASSRGTGLILTGAAGTYDAVCRPLGYGLIVANTGAARAEELETRDMAYATFPAASPLAADIPPGARLDLNPGRQIALRTSTRDAFYSDYSLQPQPAHHEPLVDAALTHAMIGGHRVVYWGFELSDVVALPWDRAIARLLVRNSVAWAADEPFAAVEPWPLGKRAAASIAQDVESGFRQRALRRRLAQRRRRSVHLLSHLGTRRALRASIAPARRVGRDRYAHYHASPARRSARAPSSAWNSRPPSTNSTASSATT